MRSRAIIANAFNTGVGAVVARNDKGFGLIGDTGHSQSGLGTAGVWGRQYGSAAGAGVFGTAAGGIGVLGYGGVPTESALATLLPNTGVEG